MCLFEFLRLCLPYNNLCVTLMWSSQFTKCEYQESVMSTYIYIYIYIHYVVWSNTNLIHAYSHLFTEKAFLSSSFLFFPYCLNTTNFIPLHLSVGHNLLRRLWFLPHSGFELVLFLCDVWTFQWWSCWTLPRAESATHDKTLELFSSAKYLHSSLFHMMLLFSLLSFAANTTLCELCQ